MTRTMRHLSLTDNDENANDSTIQRRALFRGPLLPLVLLLLYLLTLPGCTSGWFTRDGERKKGPFSWVSRVILPPGESFYSERSREIEESLNTNHKKGM